LFQGARNLLADHRYARRAAIADPTSSLGSGAGVYLFAGHAALSAHARLSLDTSAALHHLTGASGSLLTPLGDVSGGGLAVFADVERDEE
jgi:hypothetical protein